MIRFVLSLVLLTCVSPLAADEVKPIRQWEINSDGTLSLVWPVGDDIELECPSNAMAADLPAEIRKWFRNPDGSCVQCSIGMCGVDQNVPVAATLLWDTEYGPRERGGSNPSRVANYARTRGIKIYNITGSSTIDWMKWSCRNGRPCAIGAATRHFQTLMGYDPDKGRWYVCNNNSPSRIDEYDEDAFRRLHRASGEWIVILDYPAHPARPEFTPWWEEQGTQ